MGSLCRSRTCKAGLLLAFVRVQETVARDSKFLSFKEKYTVSIKKTKLSVSIRLVKVISRLKCPTWHCDGQFVQ